MDRGRGNQLLDAVQEGAAGKLHASAGEGVQSQTFHDNTVLFTVLPQAVARKALKNKHIKMRRSLCETAGGPFAANLSVVTL
jgi:hypothetical protein